MLVNHWCSKDKKKAAVREDSSPEGKKEKQLSFWIVGLVKSC